MIEKIREEIAEYFKSGIFNISVSENSKTTQELNKYILELRWKSYKNSTISCITCGCFQPWRLIPNEKKFLSLVDKTLNLQTSVNNYKLVYQENPDLNVCFAIARSAFEQQIARCNELTACLFLSIAAERKLSHDKPSLEAIAFFCKNGDSHAFIVENRNEGNLDNINSWNDNAVMHCAWYNVSISVKNWKENADIRKKYPLLGPMPGDKIRIYAELKHNSDVATEIPEEVLLKYYQQNKSFSLESTN